MDHLYVYSVLIIITFIRHTTGKDFCWNGSRFNLCDYGCCGEGLVQECCPMSTGAIIGLAVGGGLLLILIVSCICCIVCCLKKSKTRMPGTGPGTAVYPATNTNTVLVHNTNPAFSHPAPSYNPQPPPSYSSQPPPSYSQYDSFPSSNNSNPAFPPGSTAGSYPAPDFKH